MYTNTQSHYWYDIIDTEYSTVLINSSEAVISFYMPVLMSYSVSYTHHLMSTRFIGFCISISRYIFCEEKWVFFSPQNSEVFVSCKEVLENNHLIFLHVLGIAVGHIYFFLEDVFPNQPGGGRLLRTPSVL